MRRIVLLAVAALCAAHGAEPWEEAVRRSAVVFDRPNGPGCVREKKIHNGKVEVQAFLTGRPEYVMPVGAGNLSAMVNFGDDTFEIHLSQADWLFPEVNPGKTSASDPQLMSPGHVAVKFADLSTNRITRFEQKMDMSRGRVTLSIGTTKGEIAAEIFGDRATGALVLYVNDAREGLAAPVVTTERKMESLAVVRDRAEFRKFKLAIGADETAAKLSLGTDDAMLAGARDSWWREYWRRGWIRLEGDEKAKNLEKWWYVNVYAYANVGYARLPPKFNGGPGIVTDDIRCWGRSMWWQNTREMIWPMPAANRLEFAKRYLEFYSDCLGNLQNEIETRYPEFKPFPNVIVLPEIMDILRSPLFAQEDRPLPEVTAPYVLPADAERKSSREARLARNPSHVSHIYSSGTELLQQMIEYVRFSGDRTFLPRIAKWLRANAELYLVLLEKGEDGKYHTYATHVNESWWLVDDSIVDLAAARFTLAMTVAHGERFGFPKNLIEVAKDRLDRLADFPHGGVYKLEKMTVAAIAPEDTVYHPCRIALGLSKANFENNELYLVFPFAMAGVDEEGPRRTRALETWKHGLGAHGGFGWLPVSVAVARMRDPKAADVVYNHGHNTCGWPYGGGRSPGSPMYIGAPVEDTVYLDGSCVVQTGVQELLLQSHAEEPDSRFFEGGPIRFVPCVPKSWSGAFKLRARGGFIVEGTFKDGAIKKTRVTSERGNRFVWIAPATGEKKSRETKIGEIFDPFARNVLPWGQDHRIGGTLLRGKDCLYAVGGGNRRGMGQIVRVELGTDGLPTGKASNVGQIIEGNPGATCAAISGKWLFVAGGEIRKRTVRFEIAPDGSLTNRTEISDENMPQFSQAGMVASGTYLIVLGGWQSRQVYAAEVSSDGGLGPWIKQRPLPSISFCGNRVFRYGNRIYVSGNSVFRSTTDRVYSAEVDENGLCTRWRRFAELPEEAVAYDFTLMPDGKSVFYLSMDSLAMYTAPLDQGGEIGEWRKYSETFPEGPYTAMLGIPLNASHYLRYAILLDDPRQFLSADIVELE